jgi:hypothetical protein
MALLVLVAPAVGEVPDPRVTPQGQEIPMSKIKQGERSGKRLDSPTNHKG